MDARTVAKDGTAEDANDIILSGLRILELYGSGATALTTSEIAERAGLPLPRVRQLVDTLTRFRYIARLPDSGRYWPEPIVRAMRDALERSTSNVRDRVLRSAPEIFQQTFPEAEIVLNIEVRTGLTISRILTWPAARQTQGRGNNSTRGTALPLHQSLAGLAWVWAEKFETQVELLKQINLLATKAERAAMFEIFAQLTRDGACAQKIADEADTWHIAVPVVANDSVVAVISCRTVGNESLDLRGIREALLTAAGAFTHAL